jgi:cytochrome c peroxidase
MARLNSCARVFRYLAVFGLIGAIVGCKEKQSAPPAKGGGEPRAVVEGEAAGASAEMKIEVPLGLPPVPVPADNPMTQAKVELGKRLYFDKRLSKDESLSCATCHDPKTAWAEHKPVSEGIHGQKGERNAPTVINAAYMSSQFWDGRAKTLEDQALGPITNPIEMGMESMDSAVENIADDADYKARFQAVFGTEITQEGMSKAIAAFERTVLSGNSPYDRFRNGDESALTEAQKRGWEIFDGKGQCSTCHSPPTFSSGRFYNAGVGMDAAKPDEGRKKETGKDSDLGKFRVPALREVANTAPYFHNGSAATLADAVQLMASGGKDNPNLSSMIKAVREAQLTDQDKKDLVEFLKALSGEYPVIESPFQS